MNTKQSVVLASASAVAAGVAQGAVISSGPLDLTQVYSASTYRQGFSIVTGGGTNDVAFGFEAAANKPYVDARTSVDPALPYQSGIVSFLAKANDGLPVTAAGTMIDATYAATFPPVSPSGIGRAYFFDDGGTGNQTGDWSGTATTEGYVGIELALSSGNSFGWLHFIDNPSAQSLTLVDWAYESTPNQGILIAEVPEPSALALGGAGLAALLMLKRRNSPRFTGSR